MKECVICGGGASVTEGVETGLWDKLKESGIEVWSVNYAFRAMKPLLPTKQLWCDTTFFKNNIKDLEELAKSGVECHTKKNDRYNFINNIIQHECTRKPEEKDNKVFIGALGLSGMFSLSLAVQMKYDTIYLLGMDFGVPNQGIAQTHFYQGKMEYISTGVGRPQVYLDGNSPKKAVRDFDIYKDIPNIFNVSLISNIQSYRKIGYPEFYGKISKKEKDSPLL